MRFEDFVLQFDASSRGGFRARVLKSPFGAGVAGFSLPSLDGAQPDPSGTSRDIGHSGAAAAAGGRAPVEIGSELFRTVFQGQVRTLLDKSLGQLERSQDLGLRLKIKLDPADAETGSLADLPWELLCDGETEDFFALSRHTSLVRYLDVPRSSQPIPFTPPLRILAVAASPRSLPPLNLEEEARRLEDLNRSSSGVEVRVLPNASASAVREALSGDTYNVVHFMGHGTFDRASGEGMLAFERPDGSPELVSGRAFATKIRDLRSLGVVVLNACNTAKASHQEGGNPFRGVATALVLGGVPAVVAMQRPISDFAAIGFSGAFYRHLARGDSVDVALTEGRQGIHSAKPETFEWATPVLFLRIPEGNVFVARPAGLPEAIKPPALPELLPELPPTLAPQAPASPRRGLMVKLAFGAGALLVALVLYKTILYLPDEPAGSPIVETSDLHNGLTTDDTASPSDGGKASAGDKSNRNRSADSESATEGLIRESGARQPPTREDTKPDSPPESSPTSAAASEITAPTADLSTLSGQMISIARRDEGGLRATVSFKNAGGLPLAVIIDAESSSLSDNQGQRYSILESDLPRSGDNLRLDLAAGASSRRTFDFQVPKLGSTQFYLALTAEGGRPIRISGASMTLEGPP